MSTQRFEVQDYFEALDSFAIGDIDLFHLLSKKAEDEEKAYATLFEGVDYKIDSSTTNSTTFQTTKPPPPGGYPFASPILYNFPRATIPFAMMIFSCMEFLGFLYSGINSGSGYTKKNIDRFLDHTITKPTNNEIICLIELFRHGLAHNYFPKLGYLISYHTSNQNFLFFPIGGTSCLNVNYLEKLFLEGYEKIKKDIPNYHVMDIHLKNMHADYLRNKKCSLI